MDNVALSVRSDCLRVGISAREVGFRVPIDSTAGLVSKSKTSTTTTHGVQRDDGDFTDPLWARRNEIRDGNKSNESVSEYGAIYYDAPQISPMENTAVSAIP